MKNILRSFAIAVLAFFMFSGSSLALANDTKSEGNWTFNLAPFYLWAVTMEGDMTVGTTTVPVSVPFDTIFDSLESAFIVHFEGMYQNKWGMAVDINYLDLASSMSLPSGAVANLDMDITLAEFLGFYRMQHDRHSIDVIAGLRYAELANVLTVSGGPTLNDGSQDWLDPLIGARWIWNFADNWSLITRGDIGGFGVGSDFAWQAAALLDWQAFKYASFILGYRALYMDYEDGSGRNYFKYDATVHGPVLGLNFRW